MRTTTFTPMLSVWLTMIPALPAGAEMPDPRLRFVELADGLVAAVQPAETRFVDCNAVVAFGADEILVVDPPSARWASRQLAEEIRRRSPAPLSTVVMTHWHGDHTEGVAALRAALPGDPDVVGHETLERDVPDRAATSHAATRDRYEELLPQARQQLVDGLRTDGSPLTEEDRESLENGIARVEAWLSERGDARFVPPTLAYQEKLVLDRAGRRIELHHFVGHTAGDTVVLFPEEKVLVAGDLVDEMPFAGHGFPRRWVDSLDRLARLDFDRLVPGHGGVHEDRELLEAQSEFLADLVGQVEKARRQGRSRLEAHDAVDLSQWRAVLARDARSGRIFDGMLGEAIDRTWADLEGELEAEIPPRDAPSPQAALEETAGKGAPRWLLCALAEGAGAREAGR